MGNDSIFTMQYHTRSGRRVRSSTSHRVALGPVLYSTDSDDDSYEPSVSSVSTEEEEDLSITSSEDEDMVEVDDDDESIIDFDNLTDNADTEDDESDDSDSDSCDL